MSKISEQDKQKLIALSKAEDWEAFHSLYDDIQEERLLELDKELVDELKEVSKNAHFWYA